MNACVILHNMIIDSEKDDPVTDTEPYFRMGPLAVVDQQMPTEWAAFLNMRSAIRDAQTHQRLQADLVEHLWRRKGEANADAPA